MTTFTFLTLLCLCLPFCYLPYLHCLPSCCSSTCSNLSWCGLSCHNDNVLLCFELAMIFSSLTGFPPYIWPSAHCQCIWALVLASTFFLFTSSISKLLSTFALVKPPRCDKLLMAVRKVSPLSGKVTLVRIALLSNHQRQSFALTADWK